MVERQQGSGLVLEDHTSSVVEKVHRSPNGDAKPRRRSGKHKLKQEVARTTRAMKGSSQSLFPLTPFENALALGEAIQKHAAGQKIRRLTLFEKMDKSPESGPSRMMITNSSKYGITVGGYKAEFIELSDIGQ